MDNPYQQARCPECGHNLAEWTKPHIAGCKWQQQQAALARNALGTPEQQKRLNAGLQNAFTIGRQCDPRESSQDEFTPSDQK